MLPGTVKARHRKLTSGRRFSLEIRPKTGHSFLESVRQESTANLRVQPDTLTLNRLYFSLGLARRNSPDSERANDAVLESKGVHKEQNWSNESANS